MTFSRVRVRTLMLAVALAVTVLALVILYGPRFDDLHFHDFYFGPGRSAAAR